MKRKGHNHKESFSVLFISNTGQKNRQFHISRTTSRVVIVMLLVLFVAAGGAGALLYRFLSGDSGQGELRANLETQQQLVQQLEAEKEKLNAEMAAVTKENETLRQEAENRPEEEESRQTESEPEPESAIPRLYPSSGTSSLISNFSEEQPYLSINTHTEGSIVATGAGTVISVTSDDTYPVIVEVEHAKGYRTRYLSRQEAEVQTAEGAQVEAGDTLFSITTDDTQLDYQVIFNDEPIDPLTVFDAKG